MSSQTDIDEIIRLCASIAPSLPSVSNAENLTSILATIERMFEYANNGDAGLARAINLLKKLRKSFRETLEQGKDGDLPARDVEFYSLLEAEPKLKSLYMVVSEAEYIDLVSSRLGALQNLANTRPLSQAELDEVKELEALRAEATANMSACSKH